MLSIVSSFLRHWSVGLSMSIGSYGNMFIGIHIELYLSVMSGYHGIRMPQAPIILY
jgi:hypothetical protein